MIENYVNYLNFLNEKLTKFFNMQKPYIFCKKGCAKCCKNAQFPYSMIEFRYLIMGAATLPKEVQNEIDIKIKSVLKEKNNFKGDRFLYDCPFLIDDNCTVYEYRGVVCRTFGLITSEKGQDKTKIPFCAFQGLNYSNVTDFEHSTISEEKFKSLGVKEEPAGFHIGYDFLTNEDFEKKFNLKFGDKKPLVEWFG